MALFKSKQEKEIEKKMLVKRTINTMNKQINALEEQKKVFVEKAKTAKKNGLEAQYNLALTGYKMTLLQQKRAQEMLLNFEITSQMNAERQAEQMDMFMETSQDTFKSAQGSTDSIDDKEIKEMIDRQAGLDEFGDDAIDKELEELQKKMNAE